MPATNPGVDAYIARSAEFAQPILRHLRALVHRGAPESVEVLKWGFPHFDYKGMMCSMAAFKAHCSFGFWKGKLILDGKGSEDGMGQFGRITALSDLPSDAVLLSYIKKAVALNQAGVKKPVAPKPVSKKKLVVPKFFKDALARSKKARTTFESFSPSHQREYVEWVTEAKTEETRNRRLQTTLEWLTEGKPRYWKYLRK